MRLQQYINEEKIDPEKIVEMIKKDCKPYLKECNSFIYRGYRGKESIIKKKPRMDRLPKNMSTNLQEIFDKEFKRKFGWKVRSEGVFCTGDPYNADYYGNVFLFFPIGNYKYVWSPEIRDLFEYLRENYNTIFDTDSSNFYKEVADEWDHMGGDKVPFKEYYKIREKENMKMIEMNVSEMVDSYTNKGINKGLYKMHEMVFKCKEYYLVNKSYLEDIGVVFG